MDYELRIMDLLDEGISLLKGIVFEDVYVCD